MAFQEIGEKKFDGLVMWLAHEKDKNIWSIVFAGTMDTTPVTEARTTLRESCLAQRANYVIDTEGVSYISSSGLGLLVTFYQNKQNFALFSKLNDDIRKPFQLLGIERFFTFYSSREDLEKKGVPLELINKMEDYKRRAVLRPSQKERWMKILLEYVPRATAIQEIRNITPLVMQAEKVQEISLPSEEKYACVLYKFIENALRKAGIGPDKIDDASIELAAREVMTNAVKHGYNYRKDGIVDVSYAITPHEVVINITDYGVGIKSGGVEVSKGKGLPLLRRIFDAVIPGPAPKKPHKGISLGPGTNLQLIKYLK